MCDNGYITCPACLGERVMVALMPTVCMTTVVVTKPCPTCHGTGLIPATVITFSMPPYTPSIDFDPTFTPREAKLVKDHYWGTE